MNLDNYENTYEHSRSIIVRMLWYLINHTLFRSFIPVSHSLKCFILRAFGAEIGVGVVIKPRVNIKFPWCLEIGDNSWIGEDVWIDNLGQVKIGKNCCISQGAFLLTGNHDYTSYKFNLLVKDIEIKDCSWIGAKAIVCPGVIVGGNAVLSVSSVATKSLDDNYIYQGNPATKKKMRFLK